MDIYIYIYRYKPDPERYLEREISGPVYAQLRIYIYVFHGYKSVG